MSRISVVIPTYNRSDLVRDAIESAVNQDYRDKEILVVDDGSRDSTRETVAPYVKAGVVRYSWQENSGVSAARNKGLLEARGAFVAFLDSDDMWMPGHLTQLHKALGAHREARVAFSNFTFIGDSTDAESQSQSFRKSTRTLLNASFSQSDDGRWLSNERLLEGLLTIGFPFRIQGCMVDADFVRARHLQFDEAVSYTEEAQFAIEAACHTRFVFVEDVGLLVRRHDENIGDWCYQDKISASYEKRIRRMKALFGGTLVGDDRRAFKYALGKMQTHIMNERVRHAGVRKTISEGMRLLTEAPSYESVKCVTKMLVHKWPK